MCFCNELTLAVELAKIVLALCRGAEALLVMPPDSPPVSLNARGLLSLLGLLAFNVWRFNSSRLHRICFFTLFAKSLWETGVVERQLANVVGSDPNRFTRPGCALNSSRTGSSVG